eukprot:7482332-Pyramimonas_sp.AAC.1
MRGCILTTDQSVTELTWARARPAAPADDLCYRVARTLALTRQYQDAQTVEGIIVLRVDAPIYFANVDFIKAVEGIIVLRVDAPIYFANVDFVKRCSPVMRRLDKVLTVSSAVSVSTVPLLRGVLLLTYRAADCTAD